jgi:2-phospho-L-lactate guanylyltransferase (CobY/MobA/RfbA family)
MLKKLLLCASLLVSSISLADITEAEANQLAKDIEAGMEIIKSVGGFYLVSISKIPAAQTKTINKIIATASQSELCVDFRSSADEQLLVFIGPEGAQEAKEIKHFLEKKGCVVELLELI